MRNKKIRPETDTALKAIFAPAMPEDEWSEHLTLIATGIILALRQIESDEFVLGYLTGAIDDIQHNQGRAH